MGDEEGVLVTLVGLEVGELVGLEVGVAVGLEVGLEVGLDVGEPVGGQVASLYTSQAFWGEFGPVWVCVCVHVARVRGKFWLGPGEERGGEGRSGGRKQKCSENKRS